MTDQEMNAGLLSKTNLLLAARWMCVVVPVVIWFAPIPLEPNVKRAIAVSLFMVIGWITEALPHAVTGLIGCFLFWALGIVKVETAFSGFANSTPWFLYGAILIGMMAQKSGLARRIAFAVLSVVGTSYSRILLGVILADVMLTFLVPSGIARVTIMAAVALGLISAFGVSKGSNIGRGIFLMLTYDAGIYDKMIIAGAASITARGFMESVGGVEVLWSQWFLAFFPGDFITMLVAWRLCLRFFKPELPELPGGKAYLRDEIEKMGPWSKMEKQTAVLMIIAILLWLSDFIHHVSPALIGFGVGLFALLPKVGVLTFEDLKKVNYLPVFFVASCLTMGNVLIATDALPVLTDVVFAWMTPLLGSVYSASQVLYWTAFAYHFLLASEISMLATSIPLLMQLSLEQGLNPLAVGLMWTYAAGGKMFVYQSAVLVVGYSYGYFEARDLLKMGFWITVTGGVILFLLAPFYWPLIGIHY